jgi:hypothetical protein
MGGEGSLVLAVIRGIWVGIVCIVFILILLILLNIGLGGVRDVPLGHSGGAAAGGRAMRRQPPMRLSRVASCSWPSLGCAQVRLVCLELRPRPWDQQ